MNIAEAGVNIGLSLSCIAFGCVIACGFIGACDRAPPEPKPAGYTREDIGYLTVTRFKHGGDSFVCVTDIDGLWCTMNPTNPTKETNP